MLCRSWLRTEGLEGDSPLLLAWPQGSPRGCDEGAQGESNQKDCLAKARGVNVAGFSTMGTGLSVLAFGLGGREQRGAAAHIPIS